MVEAFEQNLEKGSEVPLSHMLEVGLIDIFGQADAQEHIAAIHQLDDGESMINYIYGALLANGHRPEDILIVTGILEIGEETE